jgi:hypothetical protein
MIVTTNNKYSTSMGMGMEYGCYPRGPRTKNPTKAMRQKDESRDRESRAKSREPRTKGEGASRTKDATSASARRRNKGGPTTNSSNSQQHKIQSSSLIGQYTVYR